jgi:hypothetical protein
MLNQALLKICKIRELKLALKSLLYIENYWIRRDEGVVFLIIIIKPKNSDYKNSLSSIILISE